uniref:Uncharacterized protein n=1 Tax=Plectus sambesii TaxID=2011161 RepID=A0A914UNZ2_9BILA
MSNRPSTGAGTRHSSRIAGSASATSSIRKRSAAEPLSPPSSPKQRKRVDLAEMKELCNELLTRRLRQLTLLRDRRREIVAEQHFFRNNGSAVDFSSWMADVAPNDATLDAVVQTELGELDVGDIETRLLGIPLSRIALSPTVKQESAASATPSTSAASIRNQLEVVVTPTTIEPPSAAMTVRSPSTASVSSFSAPSKSVA